MPARSAARYLRLFIVATTSVLLSLMGLEICVRVFYPQDIAYWDSSSFRRLLPTTPHFVENIPNAHSTFLGIPVSINDLGLRGPHIAVPKPPYSYRILVVGDSITFGYGVSDREAYPHVLETLLNNDCHAVKYEVLNGATLGGGLSDYYHFLATKAPRLQPDLLVVGIALNDILPYTDSGGTGEQVTGMLTPKAPWAQGLNHYLLRHSHLYLLSYAKLKSFFYTAGLVDMNKAQEWNLLALREPSPEQSVAWTRTAMMLERISYFATTNHIPIIMLSFPLRMQLSSSQLQLYRSKYRLNISPSALDGYPQRRLNEIATHVGAGFVDLLPAFRRHPPDAIFFHNDKIIDDASHLSPLGHQITAAEVMRVLHESICGPRASTGEHSSFTAPTR